MSLNKEILTSILKENICDVTFTKKDGTERVMKSTLMEEYVKPLLTPSDTNDTKTERKENPNQVRVVDLEKKAWRSFNADTVKSITLTEIVNEGVASIDSTQETDKPLTDNTSDENILMEAK